MNSGQLGDGATGVSFHARLHDPEDDDTTGWSVVVDQYVRQHGDKLVVEVPHVTIYNGDEVNGHTYW